MRRVGVAVGLALVAVLGVTAGFVAVATVDSDRSEADPTPPQDDASPIDDAQVSGPSMTASTTADPTVAETVMLAWTSGGLPSGFAEQVSALDHVRSTTTVSGDQVDMVATHDDAGRVVDHLADGWRTALDALAIDPDSYRGFVPIADQSAIGALDDGEALLTEVSSRLRHIGEGGTITLIDGTTLEVAGVVSDTAGAGAELLVTQTTGVRVGIVTPRYVLFRTSADRASAEIDVASPVDNAPVRVRAEGESPFLRHGDAVVTQAFVKVDLGEFSYRPLAGRDIEIDPVWLSANIIDADVAILGSVRCHRRFVEVLEPALDEIAALGLSRLIDPTRTAGCHVARTIAPGLALSRHAWGAAIDLNIDRNPRGSYSTQDPRLVEVLTDQGLAWGGDWLVPDPGHYEWLEPRSPS